MALISLRVLLLVSICSMLCKAVPLTYRKPGESGERLYSKLFPDDERTSQDEWSRNTKFVFVPKYQSISDQQMRKDLLRDILLDMNKRRLEQTGQVKRGQRCHAGYGCTHGDESLNEAESRQLLALARKEPGKMLDMSINEFKEYDMELEKELRNFEDSRRYISPNQM
ncbi:unnamed protein product [Porites lobata]|uniref:Uncharacterized protein n=1 Tax=Porites lobata TaxID=104759 RepID=A0ABN8QHD0_9CNID|nr:unnamed protein product [Porites lobata]